MTASDILDRAAVPAIAELCARALDRPPAAQELAGALFAPDDRVIVRGDPTIAVVASVPAPDGAAGEGYIRLLVVDPAYQGHGHGRALLRAGEADVVGDRREPTVITVGADAPYFLFPGVETTQLAMLCLLERCHYHRDETNFNMDIDPATVPPGPGVGVLAAPADRPEVAAFAAEHWPGWSREALRALDGGTLVIGRDRDGIVGFCAWDVNRAGLLGPVAVRGDLIGKGMGQPLVLSALHRMRVKPGGRVEVVWVGPIVPYARLGATVGRVFFVYRRTLPPRTVTS